jgi:hypothetical protein
VILQLKPCTSIQAPSQAHNASAWSPATAVYIVPSKHAHRSLLVGTGGGTKGSRCRNQQSASHDDGMHKSTSFQFMLWACCLSCVGGIHFFYNLQIGRDCVSFSVCNVFFASKVTVKCISYWKSVKFAYKADLPLQSKATSFDFQTILATRRDCYEAIARNCMNTIASVY